MFVFVDDFFQQLRVRILIGIKNLKGNLKRERRIEGNPGNGQSIPLWNLGPILRASKLFSGHRFPLFASPTPLAHQVGINRTVDLLLDAKLDFIGLAVNESDEFFAP